MGKKWQPVTVLTFWSEWSTTNVHKWRCALHVFWCVPPARHRSSYPCQQRRCSVKLNKAPFILNDRHYFKNCFRLISGRFPWWKYNYFHLHEQQPYGRSPTPSWWWINVLVMQSLSCASHLESICQSALGTRGMEPLNGVYYGGLLVALSFQEGTVIVD